MKQQLFYSSSSLAYTTVCMQQQQQQPDIWEQAWVVVDKDCNVLLLLLVPEGLQLISGK
jgi:hypothetical protein